MHDQIQHFAASNGLPADLAPRLAALFVELARSGALAGAIPTIDSSVGDRSPVSLEGRSTAPSADPIPRQDLIAGRYEDLGVIGSGGMGEVRRVRDVELNRTLAMKTLHAPMLAKASVLARFLDEAQATAQLQHPNLVPVYDIGRLADGRLWFTMREVQGRTLGDVVNEVHAVSAHAWETGAQGWTFRRVMSAFLSVCRAVAYDHERGVVHRDLKPNNVMIGAFGEVYVLDWGLARIVGRPDLAAEEGELDVVQTSRGSSDEHRTELGRVVGTPTYMPPEQARGEVDRIDARSDVYALGGMLYAILSGRPPYEGRHPPGVLHQVLAGPPLPVGQAAIAMTLGFGSTEDVRRPAGPPLPAELVEACERAMARAAGERFQRAEELAAEVEAWLDGARRREQAQELTQRALAGVAEADGRLAQAAVLRAQSEGLLEGVEPWQPEEDKAAGWAKAAEADEAERLASLKQLEVDQGLHGALQVAPDLAEAHAALAQRYRQRHAEAESARDGDAVARAEVRVRIHLAALPEDHVTRNACATYLKGDGALTLVTDPPGAEVGLYRYEARNRRLVEVFERSLGSTSAGLSW